MSLEPELPRMTEGDFDEDSGYRLLLAACTHLKTSGCKAPKRSEIDLLWTGGTMTSELPETALDLSRRAAAAPGGRMPSILSIHALMPYLNPTLQLSQLLEVSAARKASGGDPEGAMRELESALRLGSLVSRGGVVIHHLVGIACQGPALRGIRLCALGSHLPPDELRKIQERLCALEEDLPLLTECLRQEARMCLSEVPRVYRDPAAAGAPAVPPLLLSLLGSTPETSERNLASVFTHLVAKAEGPYDRKGSDPSFLSTWSGQPWRIVLKKDPLGYVMAATLTPALGKARFSDLKRLTELRATRAVLAVQAFRAETGRLPKDLNEICPRFLPEVPLDPFDGKPLRYTREENGSWKIASVGPDPATKRDYLQGKDLEFPSTEFTDLSKK